MSCPISFRCWVTAFTIGISFTVTPADFISARALLYVLPVVPNPGMVIPMMFCRGRFSKSKVLTATSNASVESSPPETPMVIVFTPVCSNLLANPAVWMLKTSLKCSSSFSGDGIKGCGLNSLSNLSTQTASSAHAISGTDFSRGGIKLLFFSLSLRKAVISISETIISLSREKRFPSARSLAFSAMVVAPEKTRSVDDSPHPAEA